MTTIRLTLNSSYAVFVGVHLYGLYTTHEEALAVSRALEQFIKDGRFSFAMFRDLDPR